ncbi:unnamed protein product, partial [Cylindrotheca closterium]
MANEFLYNSDRAKYQSRIDGMTAQYTLKHLDFKQRCTFPTTLENAADVLNQHKHDNRKKNSNGGNSNGQGKQNKSNNNQNDGAQFTQQQTRACFVCGSKDHVAPQCADKLKPREKWKNPDKYRDYSENGRGNRQNMQRDENATRDDDESGDSNTQWNYGRSNNGSHGGQFIQRGRTDDDPRPQGIMLFQLNNYRGIHLDSGSTFHLRTNEDDFKEGTLQGIDGGFHYTSNIQGRRLYREGIDNIFDSVCKLDTQASDNVNSLSNMVKDGFDVLMDTKRENSFFVTRNGTTWRFGHRDGLYTLVDEPAVATAMFHNHARGIDNAGVDPRFDIEIERYKGMAFILQRDRINMGEPMNEYYDLWKWTKFAQWCYELAKDRRWDFDGLDIFARLPDTFAEEAKRRGILKDFHEWTDGRGFIFDEVPAGMELDQIHIVPNNLNDDMEG